MRLGGGAGAPSTRVASMSRPASMFWPATGGSGNKSLVGKRESNQSRPQLGVTSIQPTVTLAIVRILTVDGIVLQTANVAVQLQRKKLHSIDEKAGIRLTKECTR